MGNTRSKDSEYESHFSLGEVKRLRKAFLSLADDKGTIDKSDFKLALTNHVAAWSAGAQYMFLERLFDAFDTDGNHRIDLEEFIKGLSIFFKGTEDEKMELSFRLYDINRSGTIEPKELIKVLIAMYSDFYKTDQTEQITQTVKQIYRDFDINGDGTLSIVEFRLMALKEPMIVNFVEEFLRIPDDRKDLMMNPRVSLLDGSLNFPSRG